MEMLELEKRIDAISALSDQKEVRDIYARMTLLNRNDPEVQRLFDLAAQKGII